MWPPHPYSQRAGSTSQLLSLRCLRASGTLVVSVDSRGKVRKACLLMRPLSRRKWISGPSVSWNLANKDSRSFTVTRGLRFFKYSTYGQRMKAVSTGLACLSPAQSEQTAYHKSNPWHQAPGRCCRLYQGPSAGSHAIHSMSS